MQMFKRRRMSRSSHQQLILFVNVPFVMKYCKICTYFFAITSKAMQKLVKPVPWGSDSADSVCALEMPNALNYWTKTRLGFDRSFGSRKLDSRLKRLCSCKRWSFTTRV